MGITFQKDGDYSGARIVATSGRVKIGAVFPPIGCEGAKWQWMMWVRGNSLAKEGSAKSELAAKNAVATAWEEFMRAAGVTYPSSGGSA